MARIIEPKKPVKSCMCCTHRSKHMYMGWDAYQCRPTALLYNHNVALDHICELFSEGKPAGAK